mmetsp:Transcript_78623/g.141833  ORF Transcript_78623/g.141833 Transcript_78623/m.141833 type:complete len:246 (+) Transcript_78623:172-909(+)
MIIRPPPAGHGQRLTMMHRSAFAASSAKCCLIPSKLPFIAFTCLPTFVFSSSVVRLRSLAGSLVIKTSKPLVLSCSLPLRSSVKSSSSRGSPAASCAMLSLGRSDCLRSNLSSLRLEGSPPPRSFSFSGPPPISQRLRSRDCSEVSLRRASIKRICSRCISVSLAEPHIVRRQKAKAKSAERRRLALLYRSCLSNGCSARSRWAMELSIFWRSSGSQVCAICTWTFNADSMMLRLKDFSLSDLAL